MSDEHIVSPFCLNMGWMRSVFPVIGWVLASQRKAASQLFCQKVLDFINIFTYMKSSDWPDEKRLKRNSISQNFLILNNAVVDNS